MLVANPTEIDTNKNERNGWSFTTVISSTKISTAEISRSMGMQSLCFKDKRKKLPSAT
jgi:hypothetical protein